jgi:hypothetical protein
MTVKRKKDKRPPVSAEPLRYRLRAKRLYQSRGIPITVRRYLKHNFPCMCGPAAEKEARRT